MKTDDYNTIFPMSFIFVLLLIISLPASNTILVFVRAHQVSPEKCHFQNGYLTSISSQELSVDIYSEKGGRGQNLPIGTYRIGDAIKVLIFVSQNCTIEVDLVTPDGSTWPRMHGPVTNGTLIDYIDTQYPVGKWTLVVSAREGTASASDSAIFEVIDKEPYTYTKPPLHLPDNATTIEEVKFDGKIVRVYRYPVGYIHSWDILVDKTYFGPEIRNQTVRTQLMTSARSPDSPPGYLDQTITLGDQVQVYGLLSQKEGNDIVVTLNGFENYYIKTLRTLYESPILVLFAREVFAHNLTVKIDGFAKPGSQDIVITNVNWNWGDGQSSDQQFNATHTYAKPGTYVVLVKAVQSNGLSTAETLSVSVPKNIISEYTSTTTSSTNTEETTDRTETATGTTSWVWLSERESSTTFLAAITIVVILALLMIVRSVMKKSFKHNEQKTTAHVV